MPEVDDLAAILRNAPALLLESERTLLYSLVFGLRPPRCLEIGTHKGGSALITVAALDRVGSGHLTCIDHSFVIPPDVWERIRHRVTLLPGLSHEVIGSAEGPFDFAFIDGDHSAAGAARDLEIVLPLMSAGSYVLCHDAHNVPVREAVDNVLRHHSEVTDCGLLTKQRAVDPQPGVHWGGMRLLRKP